MFESKIFNFNSLCEFLYPVDVTCFKKVVNLTGRVRRRVHDSICLGVWTMTFDQYFGQFRARANSFVSAVTQYIYCFDSLKYTLNTIDSVLTSKNID